MLPICITIAKITSMRMQPVFLREFLAEREPQIAMAGQLRKDIRIQRFRGELTLISFDRNTHYDFYKFATPLVHQFSDAVISGAVDGPDSGRQEFQPRSKSGRGQLLQGKDKNAKEYCIESLTSNTAKLVLCVGVGSEKPVRFL